MAEPENILWRLKGNIHPKLYGLSKGVSEKRTGFCAKIVQNPAYSNKGLLQHLTVQIAIRRVHLPLSPKYFESPHKNQACHGWSRCKNICPTFVTIYSIYGSETRRIRLHIGSLFSGAADYFLRHVLISPLNASCTGRKGWADCAVCDWWRYCKALCDVKFSQMEGNGRKFRHIQLSNSVIS